MSNIDSNNSAAIIGVLGTLLGVILGSILNAYTRLGKIRIFQNSINCSLLESDSIGGFIETEGITDKTELLTIILNIDLYNTSALSRKVLRNIRIGIKTRQRFFSNSNNFRFSNSDNIINRNLLPQENINLELTFGTKNEFQSVLKSEWYIVYRNQKDKIRTKKIRKTIKNGL